MALALYRMLLWLATPFILQGFGGAVGESLAIGSAWPTFGAIDATGLDGVIWFHAVSAGEVIAAAPWYVDWRRTIPSVRTTTMTPTGAERAAAVGDVVTHRYAPYDMTFAVQRFLQQLRPSVLILQTELWPNLIHLTAARSIPIYLLNARLSDALPRLWANCRAKQVCWPVDPYQLPVRITPSGFKPLVSPHRGSALPVTSNLIDQCRQV